MADVKWTDEQLLAINEKGKNELDILLIIDNKIIVFECKTTNFDIYKTIMFY